LPGREASKYFGVCETPAANGKEYDSAIDWAIINSLSDNGPLSSGKLRENIEKWLGRPIPQRTYYYHLKMLLSDNLLNRNNPDGIGNEVFYSLSDEAKKKKTITFTESGCRISGYEALVL